MYSFARYLCVLVTKDTCYVSIIWILQCLLVCGYLCVRLCGGYFDKVDVVVDTFQNCESRHGCRQLACNRTHAHVSSTKSVVMSMLCCAQVAGAVETSMCSKPWRTGIRWCTRRLMSSLQLVLHARRMRSCQQHRTLRRRLRRNSAKSPHLCHNPGKPEMNGPHRCSSLPIGILVCHPMVAQQVTKKDPDCGPHSTAN